MNASTHNFFLLRRPLLPLQTIFAFNEATGKDPGLFEEQILNIYSDPVLQQAIFLASGELYKSLLQLLNQTFQGNRKRLLHTLYKYLIRMTTRSTPFGLFAGIVTGEIGCSTEIDFKPKNKFETCVTLNVAVSIALTEHFIQKAHIACQLLFYPNTSLHLCADRYHYTKRVNNINGEFTLVEVHQSPYLRLILGMAAKGGIKINDVITELQKSKVSAPDAEVFVSSLIQSQILVSELEISVIGEDPIRILAHRLKLLENTEKEVEYLLQITDILTASVPLNEKSKMVENVLSALNIQTGRSGWIKADMLLNERICTLDQNTVELIYSDLTNLLSLTAPEENTELTRFAKKFYDRYQDQQMPLQQIISPQTGIGYAGQIPLNYDDLHLLADLDLPVGTSSKTLTWSKLNQLRLTLYEKALRENRVKVELSDKDLEEFNQDYPVPKKTCEGFYLFGSFLADNPKSLDAGKFKFALNAMGGPSGFNLMSRFCVGNHVLEGLVSQCVGWEEFCDQDSVFAEINHLPDSHAGNVLRRPGLRKYEIPYLSGSQTKIENQILPGELLISVTPEYEIILFSKRLGKRVYPRLTSAHQYANGLPLYRFLSDLARRQQWPRFEWDWDYLSHCRFLPRIEYKHLILSKATWNLRPADFAGQELISSSNFWRMMRKKFKIPRYLQLAEGDRLILIDTESDMSLKIVFEKLNSGDNIRLIEYLERPGKGIIQHDGQHYGHEVILPFLSKVNGPKESLIPAITETTRGTRKFTPGRKWLYLKIYCSAKTGDQILISAIKPIIDRLMSRSIIEKWFLVRYQDPEPHLRLRFQKGSPDQSGSKILDELNKQLMPFQAAGGIHKIQIDTYERELERYNGISYSFAESIFCADSTAILQILSGSDCHERWKIAIIGIDKLLDDLNFTLLRKKCFTSRMQEHYFKEMHGDQMLLFLLNKKFRDNRQCIESLMNKGKNDIALQNVLNALESRSTLLRQRFKWRKAIKKLKMESLASSFIHMFLNRLFVSNHRKQELVVYHYLKKFYESKHARNKKQV